MRSDTMHVVARSPAWRMLAAAPHRPMFLLGALQLVLVMVFWLAEMAGRAGIGLAAPLPLTLYSTWAHVFLMLYGLFTFFMYGFLFTAYPRWLNAPAVAPPAWLTVAGLSGAGVVLVYAGLFLSAALLAAGLALFLAGWMRAAAVLLGIYRAAGKRGAHATLLLLEMGLGAVGVAVFLYGVVSQNASAFVLARTIGFWVFLLPVLLTVSHRMLPFFTQSALPFTQVPRPGWSLAWLVGGSMLYGVLELFDLPPARFVLALALAGIALHHTAVWGFRRSFAVRLLAMLHVAFLWFGVGMALYAVQEGLALAGVHALGRAPLHALGIGFVAGTLVAMATRVTLGHSGLALAVKAPTWFLFLAFNGVAVVRVAADLVPAGYQALNLLAAAGWLACLVPWTLRYAPYYLRPRADGRPG